MSIYMSIFLSTKKKKCPKRLSVVRSAHHKQHTKFINTHSYRKEARGELRSVISNSAEH